MNLLEVWRWRCRKRCQSQWERRIALLKIAFWRFGIQQLFFRFYIPAIIAWRKKSMNAKYLGKNVSVKAGKRAKERVSAKNRFQNVTRWIFFFHYFPSSRYVFEDGRSAQNCVKADRRNFPFCGKESRDVFEVESRLEICSLAPASSALWLTFFFARWNEFLNLQRVCKNNVLWSFKVSLITQLAVESIERWCQRNRFESFEEKVLLCLFSKLQWSSLFKIEVFIINKKLSWKRFFFCAFNRKFINWKFFHCLVFN